MKLLSPDARADRMLATCLALIAGYVDAYGLHAFAIYVSFMSGNATQTGLMAGRGNPAAALHAVLAIVCFVAGSFGGTLISRSRQRHSRQLLFGVIAAWLAIAIGALQPGAFDAKVGIATLSVAMGMMNTVILQAGTESVGLTFVTGALNRIGSHLAMAILRTPMQDASGAWDTHLRRAGLMARMLASFLIGALMFGAVTSHFGVWALLPPFLIMLALALLGK